MFMHLAPGAQGEPPRFLKCTSPLNCKYGPKGGIPDPRSAYPMVHGDYNFMESIKEHVAEIDAKVFQTTAEYLQQGEAADTTEFKQKLMSLFKQKMNPNLREMNGVGYHNLDPWAPWANGVEGDTYLSDSKLQELAQRYPDASEKWLRKKVQLEARPEPIITNYGDEEDAYTLDYDFKSREGKLTGTPTTNNTIHNSYILTQDPYIKQYFNSTLKLDPNEKHLRIAAYETNPARFDHTPTNYDHELLLNLPVEHIQAYRGQRPFYTPQLADNPKTPTGTSPYPDYEAPTTLLNAPLIRKDATDKQKAWTPRHKAGQTITGNAYRSGAFEMSGGTIHHNNTATTDHLRINDQNNQHTQTPYIYEPIFNRNSTILNIKTASDADTFKRRFIEYNETEDTYSIRWDKLKSTGIDMLIFDECKENWDYMSEPDAKRQRGFSWHGLDHSMQAYIVNGSAVCGWVRYDTGKRYAPYSGARGGNW